MQIDLDLEEPLRLDVATARAFRVPRAAAQAAIVGGRVRVNGAVETRASRILRGGVELSLTELVRDDAPVLTHLLDDALFVVVEKPAGLLTHPVGSRPDLSVVDALRAEGVELAGSVPPRVGVVHRLDRDTSGVLLLAKDAGAHRALAKQFKDRTVQKTYLALVRGRPKTDEGRIDAPLGIGSHPIKRLVRDLPGAREAVTDFRVVEAFEGVTLLEVRPHTGRTHQIRAHLAAIGTPVLGDPLYLRPDATATLKVPRLMLHAQTLSFDHPETRERITITCPPPDDFATVLTTLRGRRHPQR